MASMMKKAMIYLGLGPDEEYEQYDEYPTSTPARHTRAPSSGPASARPDEPARAEGRPALSEQPLVHPQAQPTSVSTGTVRPIPTGPGAPTQPASGPVSSPERISADREPSVSTAVRTLGPATAMPHTVAPESFNDAQEIGDRFKAGQPVIVNLQAVDRELRRRLVDFSSGLCYAIAGKMERVADQVYLLTPADVEVPPEETRRHLD